MVTDGYVVPAHGHGLVRLRPSSGGSVDGEDDERAYNHVVMSELEDELAAELALVRTGKPLVSQGSPARRSVKDHYKSPSARATPQRQPQEQPKAAPVPTHVDNGYGSDINFPSVKRRPEQTTQLQPEGTPFLDMLLEAAELRSENRTMNGLQNLWLSSSSTKAEFQGSNRPPGGFRGTDFVPPPLMNREGFRVPFVSFMMLRENGTKIEQSTEDLFRGRRVVVFAGPGAFHEQYEFTVLPRYEELVETFRENGVNDVYHIAVNDAFALDAWRKKLKIKNLVMLPDGCAHFSRALGMLAEQQAGVGRKSWRYSMLVENGEIKKMFIEPTDGDAVEVSDADTMLNYINPNAGRPQFVTVLSREGCAASKSLFNLLDSRGWKYEVLLLGDQITRHTLHAVSGTTVTPQVFLNGRHVGGTEEVERYLRTVYGS